MKVVKLGTIKRSELKKMVNRLYTIKDLLSTFNRYEVENIAYKIQIGASVEVVDELIIQELYGRYFK